MNTAIWRQWGSSGWHALVFLGLGLAGIGAGGED